MAEDASLFRPTSLKKGIERKHFLFEKEAKKL